MNKYMKWDSAKFLKDSVKWQKDIAELEEKKKELKIISTNSYDNVGKKNGHSDIVVNIVMKREEIQNQIDDIKQFQSVFNMFIKSLSEDEKEVIKAFFIRKDISIGAWVDEYAYTHMMNTRYVYRMRTDLLKRCENVMNEFLLN